MRSGVVAFVLVVGLACAEPQDPVDELLAATLPPDVVAAGSTSSEDRARIEVLREQMVVFDDKRLTLDEFAERATSADPPARSWPATIRPAKGVTYDEVIAVVDILVEHGCTDIKFAGSAFDVHEEGAPDAGGDGR